MRILKNVVIAVIAGIILAGIFDQLTTSKYPPCDLVVKGIGVATYGCSNTNDGHYPCQNVTPNSSQMTSCVQQNYYRSKTFPFGFKQSFGPRSNLIDQKPLNQNRLSSFALGFTVTLLILFLVQAKSSRLSSEK